MHFCPFGFDGPCFKNWFRCLADGFHLPQFATVQLNEFVFVIPGKRILYFGCRNQKKDFYFDCEWMDLQSKGLLQLSAAFSRDQVHRVM